MPESGDPDPGSTVSADSGPFPVPGGWKIDEFSCAGETIRYTCPAEPDSLLDDPAVLRENEEGVYVPYWALLWPAARHMSQVFQQKPFEAGEECLEIGCGIGLVGLAALYQGLNVTFSDYRQEAVELACWNARQAGFRPELNFGGCQLDWNKVTVDRRFRHIFGCEVVYETDFHQPILQMFEELLAPGGYCWLGDSGRINSERFLTLASELGWQVDRLNARLEPLTDPAIGRFQVFRLQRGSASVD